MSAAVMVTTVKLLIESPPESPTDQDTNFGTRGSGGGAALLFGSFGAFGGFALSSPPRAFQQNGAQSGVTNTAISLLEGPHGGGGDLLVSSVDISGDVVGDSHRMLAFGRSWRPHSDVVTHNGFRNAMVGRTHNFWPTTSLQRILEQRIRAGHMRRALKLSIRQFCI